MKLRDPITRMYSLNTTALAEFAIVDSLINIHIKRRDGNIVVHQFEVCFGVKYSPKPWGNPENVLNHLKLIERIVKLQGKEVDKE